MRFCGVKEGGAAQRNYRINRASARRTCSLRNIQQREESSDRICKVDFAFDENDDDGGDGDDGESVMDGRGGGNKLSSSVGVRSNMGKKKKSSRMEKRGPTNDHRGRNAGFG